MKSKYLKVSLVALLGAMGNTIPLQAATIDLGIQLVPDNVLVDSAGQAAGAVYIGNWKDSVTDYSAALAGVIASGDLPAALSSSFTIGLSTTWSGLLAGGFDAPIVFTIGSDTGLASRTIDVVFFNVEGSEYGSLRWNSAYPGTEDLARSVDVALVVPSVDSDASPSILAGGALDFADGTGQFQTIPEPSVGYLMLGAGCLWFATRRFKNKS